MYKYRNRLINYIDYGNKEEQALIFLHSWGQNLKMMEPLAKPFFKINRVIILDLPGFGMSEEPEFSWTLDDYTIMLNKLLTKLKIINPIFIGHSFGGKISLLYASKYPIKKLVLIASPYKIYQKKQPLKVKIMKFLRKFPLLKYLAEFMKNKIGSTDYKNASPLMREVLVKHVNTDLTSNAKLIKCPTLIIWGTKDMAVDVKNAYELENLIADSGTIIYEGASHYAYLEHLNQTILALKSFVR